MNRPRVLVADDDRDFVETLRESLTRAGFDVVSAFNPQEARAALRNAEHPVDVAVLDLHLDPRGGLTDWSGLEIARSEAPKIPKVLLTSDDSPMLLSILPQLRAIRAVPLLRQEGIEPLLVELRRALVPRVFLAHGHSPDKDRVARFLEKHRLEVIVLQEDGGTGYHFLDALEKYGQSVGAAVVLLTADDEGREKNDGPLTPRARQNVVFELGFFIAALGRSNVTALIEDNVEKPSDYAGIKYIPFDRGDGWKGKLHAALIAAGIEVDA